MKKKVAIIGSAFRFPSTSSSLYWSDLLAGRDLVTEVDPERWAMDTFRHPDKNNGGTSYTFAAGSIGDASQFDAGFFNISPREAALMDPQQRLLLEMSWEALENAGIKPSSLRGSQCGVYIGIASNDYAHRLNDDLTIIDSTAITGNTASIAANRISYVLDLRGPSMAIDTACSSSMVAFHQACQSILSGESTLALVGSVSLHLHPYGFIAFSKASMLSPRGRCQVFDAGGDGYVRSEGGGVFLLKDYDQAMADGNPILAVVAGSAVNTDGRKSGLTVPSAQVQADLLTSVYVKAGLDPASIDYLEAHGTGTAVGDPIETRAIGIALGKRRATPLPIGSVKSNLGHMETASGVAGLVKALHCIQHRIVPATIGLITPNPNIDFDGLNVTVVTQNMPLKETGKIIIGVNSFGFGGANAHVILEGVETDEVSSSVETKSGNKDESSTNTANTELPILLSAKDAKALRQAATEFASFILSKLSTAPETALYDISYNTIFNREAHQHRLMVSGATSEILAKSLLDFAGDNVNNATNQVASGTALAQPVGPVFIYSGNGSQWAGMGGRLLQESATFLSTIREIDLLFRRHADFSLENELLGNNGKFRYELTEIAQPALFALQVGITRMLAERGITPIAVAGHSVGEVAAAWASGALSLDDAVATIYHRSYAQGQTKGQGQMTAVGCGLATVQPILTSLASTLTIAGINSSRGITVAGDASQLTKLESALAELNIPYKRLDLDYAFHSPAMDSITGFQQTLAGIAPGPTTIPFYSTVTGELLDGRELDAGYWWKNIREPVLFEQASKQILATGSTIFIEVGPHPVMRGYLNDGLKDAGVEGRVISTLSRDNDAADCIWATVNQAIIAGVNRDWTKLFTVPGKYVALPNYPWQRERHWHPTSAASLGLLTRHKIHPLLGYPLPQQELSWENQLDTQVLPSLADHVVGEDAVFPGAGFVELALAAALAWKPGELVAIEELEIRLPLILSNKLAKLIRVSISATDGSVNIRGRDAASAEPWATHVTARLLSMPNVLDETPPVFPLRTPDFTQASHHVLTCAAGLNYGTAFQRIDYGWIDGPNALAVFSAAPAAADLSKTHLHPAILDCTFQLIVQLLKDSPELIDGIAFVPVKMGRIVFRKTDTAPHCARATLLKRSSHSLTAEFTLFDKEGRVIAVVRETRFRSVRLYKHPADQLRFLDFSLTPAPHPLTPQLTDDISFATLQTAMAVVAEQSVQQRIFNRYAGEIDPLLDSLCNSYVIQAFSQLADSRGILTAQAVENYQRNAPQVAEYFDHLLKLAEQDQTITAQDDGWKIGPAEGILPADLWRILVADYPEYFQLIHAVGRTGMHLRDILIGDIHPATLVSEAASHSALMRLVLREQGRQLLVAMVHEWISSGLEQLPAGQRLGILEISSGSPLFAADICAQLDFNISDFTFASMSDSAVQESMSMREHYPRFKSHLISTEATDPKQFPTSPVPTVQLATVQLVILQLNFTTLADTVRVLSYAKSRLIAGGSLLLIGQYQSRWMDFVFGCQANNDIIDWHSASPQFWQKQLHTMGFINTQHLSLVADAQSGPYVLVSQTVQNAFLVEQSETEIAIQRKWLLLMADETGYSAQLASLLAQKLTSQGHHVRICQADDRTHLTSLLLDSIAQPSTTPIDGIVYLSGLNMPTGSAVTLLEQQVDRCAGAAALIQACESAQINTTCWLVTANVSADLLTDYPQSTQSTISMAPMISLPDAALWGFARTLMNEASNYTVRLVDLHAPDALESIAAALSRELAQPDDETEIVLSASGAQNGARYAPRLRLKPRPMVDQATSIEDPTLRFAFQTPGQLRNLHWEALPRTLPDEHEIEVEVHATGLNFRDVMYALGLLSDEAIENGFAGPTLGLEFAGVVLNVGDKNSSFVAGDRVVGFGPSSFSNRVITRANAISLIPENLSFAEAATIPSTFLTVYYALHQLAQLQPGEKVLIHGSAGGVGIAAIQIAQWIGAEIHATAGSDEKRDFLRLWGIEHIYDSRSLSFADEILAKTEGKGIDVVLNSLSGEAINCNFRVLKPFGRFIELGKRDFYENTKIGLRPFRNNISYFGVDADQLMQVRPELTRRLFGEVMKLFSEGILHPLPYTTFDANDIISAFRYMQQAKQIGKIVVTYHQPVHRSQCATRPVKQSLRLDPDATYLVTGGLSGFGLRTAEWLATKGARHLVLISRQGPLSPEAKTSIAALEKQGAQVHAVACDVTDAAALSVLLQHINKNMPPLKGIIHAAMVVEDGLIRNMDAGQIKRVLAPKVLGALNLHQLTQNLKLDYFILFSSATTLFGNPGQGNYVAANASLEALARNRRASGLTATCIRWGAIDDVGFLARNEVIKEALQGRMGGKALKSEVALDVLESMLQTNSSGPGVLDLDWRSLARFLPAARSAKYNEMAQNDTTVEKDEDIQHLLATLSGAELQEVITSIIKHEVGEILRLAPEKIDDDRSIYDMGLDSLMGVELVIALESRLGIRMSVMAMSTTPTISKLAERIIIQFQGADKSEVDDVDKAHIEQVALQIATQHGVEISTESDHGLEVPGLEANDLEVTAESVADLVKNIQSDTPTVIEKMIN